MTLTSPPSLTDTPLGFDCAPHEVEHKDMMRDLAVCAAEGAFDAVLGMLAQIDKGGNVLLHPTALRRSIEAMRAEFTRRIGEVE